MDDAALDAIGQAIGESFFLSSQGMSEWPTLDECVRAGRRAARELRGLVPELTPWHVIVDGDLRYGDHEDHDYAVWLGGDLWECAGCLASPTSQWVADAHPGWPNLVSAPNGLQVVICRSENVAAKVHRRPLCPSRDTAWVDPEDLCDADD